MCRTLSFLSLLLISPLTMAFGQYATVELQKGDSGAKVDKGELLQRYPAGKHWRSHCTFRAVGTASKADWGLSGECEFAMVNHYNTEVKILENEDGDTIKMRIDVIEAQKDRLVTKRKMKWIGFDTNEPIFKFALETGMEKMLVVVPHTSILLTAATIYEKIDPGYQKVLTKLANKNIIPFSVGEGTVPELSLVESASDVSGCSFEAIWINGFGLIKVMQLNNGVRGAKTLSAESLRKWLSNADPLLDLYIMPTLNRKRGDKWSVDLSHANVVFTGSPDIRSSGKIELHYVNEGEFDRQSVRTLVVNSGNGKLVEETDSQESIFSVNSMGGRMQLLNRDGFILMAHGSGEIGFDRISKDHFLFQARISRDVKSEWRYEAKLLHK